MKKTPIMSGTISYGPANRVQTIPCGQNVGAKLAYDTALMNKYAMTFIVLVDQLKFPAMARSKLVATLKAFNGIITG